MRINSSVAAMQRSRVWKLIVALGGAMVVASVGISGCEDYELPVAPETVAAPEPRLSQYPTETQYAEMPAEFRQKPGIIRTWVDAGFVSSRAYGQAGMEFLANYAKITMPVTLLFNNSEVTTTVGYSEQAYFLPLTRELSANASVAVNGSCGYTVNAHAEFFIRNQFPLKTGWFEWGQEGRSGDASNSQPACSCGEATMLLDAAYDPYSVDGVDSSCGSTGTSGGDGGTQYYPGDNTGGETVNFHTGQGNGGTSACGAYAVVEYVCFDTWDAKTETWKEWGCGYVTMC
ncbi:MAG: hypothetical protein NUW01_03310 [Gemmatimonadaceae bacterium]|nr:hypothetical protein [Gemmatimonadaceae bacterium]